MILNSIILENIRSYVHEEAEFPEGISLFEGDIGSGKSTILMAIEFALFGLGSQKAESLLAKKSDEGHVILDFKVGDAEYEIKRTLGRKAGVVSQDSKKAYIRIDGVKEPLSPSELKHRVLQILRFNEPKDSRSGSRIFRYAVFTPQEEMKNVLSDPKKRLETIRRAFGIEDYAVAVTNAKDVSLAIKQQAVRFEERSRGVEELKGENLASEDRIKETEQRASKFGGVAKDLELENRTIRQKSDEMQEQNAVKKGLESKKNMLEGNIRRDGQRAESISAEISGEEKNLKEIKEKLDKLGRVKRPTAKTVGQIQEEMQKFQGISNELLKLKASVSELSLFMDSNKVPDKSKKEIHDGITVREKSLKDNENTYKEAEKELERLKEQKTRCQTNIENLQSEMAKFVKLGDKCPVCEQNVTAEHLTKLKGERERKIKELNLELKETTDVFFDRQNQHMEMSENIKELESQISEGGLAVAKIEEFEGKSSKFASIDIKIKELEAGNAVPREEFECESSDPAGYLSALKDALVEYENSAEHVANANEEYKKTMGRISGHRADLDGLASGIAKNRIEMQSIEERMGQMADLRSDISSAEQKFEENMIKIKEATAVCASASQNLENERERVASNNKKIAESEEWGRKYEKLFEYYEWIEKFFIPATSEIEKQVMLAILQRFNENYQKWYSMLVEDPTKESRIDEGFTPNMIQDGYEQEIEYLSGGEKTSVALAYRLTLNYLMRQEAESLKSNLLILDEPTDGFSKSQIGKIGKVLEELQSKQIVLVSHNKELEAHAGTIFHITKEDGVSRITRQG